MKNSFKQILMESSTESLKVGDITLSGNIKDKNKAKKLISGYDWYFEAIDDGAQYQTANKNNKKILEELKKLGVTKIENPKYSFFGTKGKTIDL